MPRIKAKPPGSPEKGKRGRPAGSKAAAKGAAADADKGKKTDTATTAENDKTAKRGRKKKDK